jgi:hypothetical protein
MKVYGRYPPIISAFTEEWIQSNQDCPGAPGNNMEWLGRVILTVMTKQKLLTDIRLAEIRGNSPSLSSS